MTKKVLILGVTGLVGNALWREFKNQGSYEVHATYHHELYCYGLHFWECDITNKTQLEMLINKIEPNIIINATAFANVDLCETEKWECWKVNVLGLKNLIETAPSAYIVHFSTDYVFDGTEDVYTEESIPDPLNFYGLSKLGGELILLGHGKSLIIRTTGVYGWELQKKNFVYRVLNTVGKGQELKVPIDQIGCPTYAPNLSEVVRSLIDKEVVGILNVSGATRLNRYEFAQLICDAFGLDKTLVKPIETKDMKQIAKRPLKGGLSIEEVKNILPETKILTAQEGLEAMKEDLLRRDV